VTASSFGQAKQVPGVSNAASMAVLSMDEAANKTNATGDTVKGRINFSSTQLNDDSLIAYRYDAALPIDSGYVLGMNPYGDKGFAERFDISKNDSAVKVIGTYVIFDGRYQPTTTKTVNISVWSQGPKKRPADSATRTKLYYNGLPTAILATQAVSIKNLGINIATKNDTAAYVSFTTPTAYFSDSFFVGYTPNWTWAQSAGDTISLKSTRDGYRYQAYYTAASNGDTVRNVKNAVQFANGTWNDEFYQNAAIGHHFCVFPVFIIRIPAGVNQGITKNNLTLFGNYPNPAADKTNIKFSLKNTADVTITLSDIAGRTIRTMEYKKMNSGTNEVTVNTSDLAAGNYIYLIRTSNGDGMGAQMTVAK
jgi:hypothetical protein